MLGVPITKAKKQLMKRGGVALAVYFAAFAGTDFAVERMHPQGKMIWLFATLPVLPIMAVVLCIGLYLREETDEFHRHMVTRCLLWGLGALMVALVLQLFMGAYGWKGQWSPLVDLFAFAVAMTAAKVTYRMANRVRDDDDVTVAGVQR